MKKKDILSKKKIKSIFTTALELPKEVILNLPLITLVGSEEMNIENYKGIVEYSEEKIRINTTSGVIKIEGKKLNIKQLTAEQVCINGLISKLEYLL